MRVAPESATDHCNAIASCDKDGPMKPLALSHDSAPFSVSVPLSVACVTSTDAVASEVTRAKSTSRSFGFWRRPLSDVRIRTWNGLSLETARAGVTVESCRAQLESTRFEYLNCPVLCVLVACGADRRGRSETNRNIPPAIPAVSGLNRDLI